MSFPSTFPFTLLLLALASQPSIHESLSLNDIVQAGSNLVDQSIHHLSPIILGNGNLQQTIENAWRDLLYWARNSTTPFAVTVKDPDQDLSPPLYMHRKGFRSATFTVTTEDGYLLTIYRLLPANGRANAGAKPVLLGHSLGNSCMDFLMNSPFVYGNTSYYTGSNDSSVYGDNLAFTLLMTGRYDVWLMNNRGNRYSRGHRTLSTNDERYWRFSWDQMAEYDVPATIDLVLNETGSATLGYVGYSQGNTIMFGALALKPRYAHLVQPFIALAPIVFVGNVAPATRVLLGTLEPLVSNVPADTLVPLNFVANLNMQNVCPYLPLVCHELLVAIGGYFPASAFNQSRYQVYGSYLPSQENVWTLLHFIQLVQSGRFARFDYGREGNMAKYNQSSAPDFPLHSLPATTKIALISASGDVFGNQENTDTLRRELANITLIHDSQVDAQWGHLNFIFALDQGRLAWKRVVEILDEHLRG